MKNLAIILASLWSFCALPVHAGGGGPGPAGKARTDIGRGTKADVSGILQTGIMAIGGETTGIVLTSAKGTIDLEVPQAYREALDKLSGHAIRVTGPVRVVPGTEIKNRRILTTKSVTFFPQLQRARGILQKAPQAVEGGRPEFTLKTEKNVFELVSGPDLKQKLIGATGEQVEVLGIPSVVDGVDGPAARGALVIESVERVPTTQPTTAPTSAPTTQP